MNQLVYYGNNDYRDYLAHHGILGQRKGVRHGPPYPLDYEDHNSAEKRGMAEKGVRYRGLEGSVRLKKPKRSGKMTPDEAERAYSRRLGERSNRAIDESIRAYSRGDIVRIRKGKDPWVVGEKKSFKERLAERRQAKIDEKKRKLTEEAIESGTAANVQRNKKLFTAEELKDITKKMDERAEASRLIEARSSDFRRQAESRQKILEKGDPKEILKNIDKFSTEELNEAALRIAARRRITDARRDEALKSIESFVQKGASITKSASDIVTNISKIKEAIEGPAKKQEENDWINKIIASGNKDKISAVQNLLNGEQAGKALKSMENQDKLDKALKDANRRSGEEQQSQQQGGKSGGQKSKDDNQNQKSSSPENQNGSASTEKKEPSQSTGIDMDEFWKSSAKKYDPSTSSFSPAAQKKINEKLDFTPMNSKANKAMDKEISKYTQMASGKEGKSVAEAISRLQTKLQTSAEKDSQYESATEKKRAADAMDAWTKQHKSEVQAKRDAEVQAKRDAEEKNNRIAANRRAGAKKAAETRKQRKETAKEVERSSQSAGSAQSLIRAFHTDEASLARIPSSSLTSSSRSIPKTSASSSSVPKSSAAESSAPKTSPMNSSSMPKSSAAVSDGREQARRALESAALSGSSMESVRNIAKAGQVLLDDLLNDNKRGR